MTVKFADTKARKNHGAAKQIVAPYWEGQNASRVFPSQVFNLNVRHFMI
jgi:hypothetical protein